MGAWIIVKYSLHHDRAVGRVRLLLTKTPVCSFSCRLVRGISFERFPLLVQGITDTGSRQIVHNVRESPGGPHELFPAPPRDPPPPPVALADAHTVRTYVSRIASIPFTFISCQLNTIGS